MSRRDVYTTSNNGIAQNGRAAEQHGYLDSSPGKSQINKSISLINLISSVGSQGLRSYYQEPPDVRSFPQPASGGVKSSSQFNNNPVRLQYPDSHHTNPNHSSQPNNQAWNRGPAQPNSQQGPTRFYPNSNGGNNGNPSVQSQNQSSKYQTLNHPPRRQQSQPVRPQVRLPIVSSSTPPLNGSQQPTHVNRDFIPSSTDLKNRTNKEYQSKTNTNSSRRHRNSTSNSSKTSTGSVLWEPVLSSSPTSTQISSPPESSTHTSSRQLSQQSVSSNNLDEEWLLLRTEILNTPRQVQQDKYGHVHPLVRKYAGQTLPEVKMGEPRWANAVMSRRWKREETLEQEKKDMLTKREEGAELPSRPVTCMTEKQANASILAKQTLEMLRRFENMDMERKKENIDNISEEEK